MENAMATELWNAVDEYFSRALVKPDPALDAALEASAKARLRAINVAPNQGKFLHLLAKINGARRILEIGTLGGYSAIWLVRALPEDGSLVSLEANPDYADVARGNLAAAGLSGKVSVLTGLAAESLEELIRSGTPPFDFIFIDADKSSYPDYLRLTLQLSRPGTVIVADNVVRSGRLGDPNNREPDIIGIRSFFQMLATTPEADSTAIQTVGAKGWDGFSITIVSASQTATGS
jgi:predicted O-methyltransferase YrrM